MGYVTSFNLTIDCEPLKARDIIAELRDNDDNCFHCIDPEGYCCNLGRWDWEEQLLIISKKYPDYLFTLDGDGDLFDDRWRADIRDGKMYHRYYELAPFDESKMI